MDDSSSVNLELLQSDLSASAICSNPSSNQVAGLDELVRNYNNTLSMANDFHTPLKTKCMVTRPTVPWYNDDINTAKCLWRRAERTWRRTKSVADLIAFEKQKNHVKYTMNQARREFYTNFIEENSTNQGRLLKAAKKLLGKSDRLSS